MSELRVKLFVSSPSDVKPERDRAVIVADRLNGTFEGLVRFEVIRWEDEFYDSSKSFQEQIDAAVGKMAEVDVLICIVWGRIGLKLNPKIWRRDGHTGYESGTVYEFETALALSKQNQGVPDVYLFRKSAEILYRADRAADDIEQHKLLETVWQRWTQSLDGYNSAGYQEFSGPDQFEEQLERCLTQWLERKNIVVKDAIWDRRIKGSPFCGLAAFETSHTAVFFGREAAIASVATKLRACSFLLLIGASGSGKSSLLRAGIIPRIVKPGVVPDIDLWRVALITPSKNPFLDLAQALWSDSCLKNELQDSCGSIDGLVSLIRDGDQGLDVIRSALGSAAHQRAISRNYASPRPARLLLAIDQLERLFVEAQAEEIESFAKFTRDLVGHKIAYAIVTLRSDSYGSFQSVQDFLALRESGEIHDLLPPNALELEDVVTRPVLACFPPLKFEVDAGGNSLASVLVKDAKGSDSLPLLQMTLEYLFQTEKARGDGVLSFSNYGGIEQAVIRVASEAFLTLDQAARLCLPALITALVHDVSLETVTARRVVILQPVEREAFERARPERTALVEAFVAHRLLTVDDFAGKSQIRAVHEALLRVWPEATQILVENENIIRVRRTIEPLVQQWVDTGKLSESDFLLTSPALLAGARQLVEQVGDDVSPAMLDYVEASVAAEDERTKRESQRRIAIMSATDGMRARSIPYYRLVAASLLAILVLLKVLNLPIIEWFGFLAFDTYQAISPRQKMVRPVTVVDVDDRSLNEVGQWPWPRTVTADLVTQLFELGAVVVGFDVIFAEPDRLSPALLANSIKDLDPETRAKLSSLPSNDEVLATTIKRWKHVVVAESGLQAAANDQGSGSKGGIAILGSDPEPHLFKFLGRLRTLPVLEQAAAGSGLLTVVPERDGILRRLPLIIKAGDTILPAMGLELLRVLTNTTIVLVKSEESGITEVGVRGLSIPTDKNGQVWVHFSRFDPGIFVSAADVLNKKAPPNLIKGKIVVIGTSAAALNDLRPTPVGRLPGAAIHAEFIENVLTRSMLSRPAYVVTLEIFYIVVIGGIFSVLMPLLSARILAVASIFTLIFVMGSSWAAFKYWKLLIDPVYPLITVATLVTVMTFFIYRYSENQRGSIRRFFELQAKK
jgi:CHASE2 domain-containing sensor protein/energy-coupling factor transporter ATP-binding protein EcfA2